MSKRIELAGKPVVISGASSGIGEVAAVSCARAGMPVVLFARREEKLRAVHDRIVERGGAAAVVVGSVDSAGDCERAVGTCAERFGSVYSVIANAGYGQEGSSSEMPEEDIRAMFETNFYGSLRLVRAALPGMVERGSGHAMMVSSGLSKIGIPYYGAYCATKAAQDHFCRAMRLELGSSGVFVSSVHPVMTETGFHSESARRSGGAHKIHRSGRMQSAQTVADAIVKCLRRPRGEVWTSAGARLGLGVSVMLPGVTDWALKRTVMRGKG